MVKYNLLLELNNILSKMEKHCDEMTESMTVKSQEHVPIVNLLIMVVMLKVDVFM